MNKGAYHDETGNRPAIARVSLWVVDWVAETILGVVGIEDSTTDKLRRQTIVYLTLVSV